MKNSERPIGFFDSGIGGLTVLKEATKLLPNEDFVYFCDQANIPYGSKDPEELKIYINDAILFLVHKNVKAIVLACNTATSLFIESLRAKHPIPFIGMEPALKPAFESKGNGDILVLATPVTLQQEKFWNLKERVDEYNDENLIVFPAAKLASMIEKKVIESRGKERGFLDIKEYLESSLKKINLSNISVVVLGCTHYIFIKNILRGIFQKKTKIVDGNYGTVKHLKHILDKKGILNNKKEMGTVEFYSSDKKFEDIDKVFKEILNNI